MSRQFLGLGFLVLSAFLYASRYFCAAIIASGTKSTDSGTFDAAYQSVGSGLTFFAVLALIIGVADLLSGSTGGPGLIAKIGNILKAWKAWLENDTH